MPTSIIKPSHSRAALALMLLASLALPAEAQKKQTKASSSAAPPPRALTRDLKSARDWTIDVEVRLHPAQARVNDPRYIQATPNFVLSELEFYYPLPLRSSMHDGYSKEIKGEFRIENVVADNTPEIRRGYQSLTALAVWQAKNVQTHQLIFLADINVTCYETRIDEAVARRVPWPTAPWSAEMALCLDEQLFVESESPGVRALVQRWAGKDPRATAPYELAKRLAGRCIEHFRITDGLVESTARGIAAGDNRAVLLSGFRVRGAAWAAAEGQGSAYDLACLMTAVYRAAGLPARLVVGYDIKASESFRSPVLRAWTEFFLARDPQPVPGAAPEVEPVITEADGEWIPVDITRQREFSSRPPPIEQRWQFFGHNEEFDFVPPIAFHWLPPENATNAGPPGLWGWRPVPANPIADTELKFRVEDTPRRGNAPKRTPGE